MAKRADRGDHRIEYRYNQGHETVRLHVSKEAQEQIIKPKIYDKWSWALAVFELPWVEDFRNAQLYARLRGGDQPDTFQRQTGIDTDDEFYRPYTKIAAAGTASDLVGGASQGPDPDPDMLEMSVLLDLRGITKGAVIADIYAAADRYGLEQTGWQVTYDPPNTDVFDWSTDVPGTYATKRDALKLQWAAAGFSETHEWLSSVPTDLSTYPGAVVLSQTPPTPPTRVPTSPTGGYEGWRYVESFTYAAESNLMTSIRWVALSWNDTLAVIAYTDQIARFNYPVTPIEGFVSIPYTGPGIVRGRMFRENPRWVWREWDAPDAYTAGLKNYRWMPTEKTDPDWADIPQLGDQPVVWPAVRDPQLLPIDDEMLRLGTLICDVEHGTIVFKPA